MVSFQTENNRQLAIVETFNYKQQQKCNTQTNVDAMSLTVVQLDSKTKIS